jgi:hypothetical protein
LNIDTSSASLAPSTFGLEPPGYSYTGGGVAVLTRAIGSYREAPCEKQYIQACGSIIHMQQTFEEACGATKSPRVGAGTDVYIVNQHYDGY